MIVVDASALANALVYNDDRGRKARAALARDVEWAAPDHWMAEVFSVVRDLTLGGKISDDTAARTIERLRRIAIDTVRIADLVPRMWQLRANISGYDAAYVALAETRGLTLVTADRRLARVALDSCRIELVAT
ncbi:putative nucleic acid-binding protein, contains PIN domain [Prauserella sp. Am3]|nr:putative nucleic acid-binding protein, contains PIN domain [Prauserella sp. Am3]